MRYIFKPSMNFKTTRMAQECRELLNNLKVHRIITFNGFCLAGGIATITGLITRAGGRSAQPANSR
jgi:hypothetical protein